MKQSPETASSAELGAVLAAFRRALAREMNVLRRDPELLWQELYNRLQWEDEQVRALLAPEFERRSPPGASPWLRTRTRFRESEALIRTLEGHTGSVNACAYSPDGARLVSASGDGTLKLWDAETGQEIHTLEGYTGYISACAFSPDGVRVVSTGGERTVWEGVQLKVPREGRSTLKLWDAGTGQEIHTLEGHSGRVNACAYSPDGARLVSASGDGTLKLWDAETGRELRTLEGHSDGVTACAFSPDGARV
ncbi:MAG: WD40 repeat domain-containing protein, partial [Gemmatimonadales bacterium]